MSDYTRNTTAQQTMSQGTQANKNTTNSIVGVNSLKVISSTGVSQPLNDSSAFSAEASNELITNGYVPEFIAGLGLVEKCEEVINGLGFALVEPEELSPGIEGTLKDFTLIGSENVDETINNSRIVDPDLKFLTPNKTSAEDKFKEETDSFYDLDQERSESIKLKTKRIKNNSPKNIAKTRLTSKLSKSVRQSPNKMLSRLNRRSLKK